MIISDWCSFNTSVRLKELTARPTAIEEARRYLTEVVEVCKGAAAAIIVWRTFCDW